MNLIACAALEGPSLTVTMSSDGLIQFETCLPVLVEKNNDKEHLLREGLTVRITRNDCSYKEFKGIR